MTAAANAIFVFFSLQGGRKGERDREREREIDRERERERERRKHELSSKAVLKVE